MAKTPFDMNVAEKAKCKVKQNAFGIDGAGKKSTNALILNDALLGVEKIGEN